jgi:sugar fermentation stimulation protein A
VDVPFPPLLEGTLLARNNRFVVTVRLADGREVAAHTNNTGTMRSCSAPGSTVYLSESTNPSRKLKYSLVLVQEAGGPLVGVDTSLPGKLFVAAMARQGLSGLEDYRVTATEVTVAPGSRLDVLLEGPRGPAYVELKNVTLQEAGRLYFPDAVTARGARHLLELARLRQAGAGEAMVVFVVQRPDGERLFAAEHIDRHFSLVLRDVVGQGVIPLAYRAEISRTGARLHAPIEVVVPA